MTIILKCCWLTSKITKLVNFFLTEYVDGDCGLVSSIAFKYSGWFFGILIFLFCLIQTNYTAKTLKKCLDADPEYINYADIAHLAFGAKGRLIMGGIFFDGPV